jgi:hypothetical protein
LLADDGAVRNLGGVELHSRHVSRKSQEVFMKISKSASFAFCAALLTGGVLLSGCATGPKLNYSEYAGEPVKSFYMANFDGWSAVSKDQLVVWAGMNKAYLLRIQGYCPDLQFAHAIAVTSTGNTVDKFEKVIVGRDRCFINEIRPLDVKQMKEDRKILREERRELRQAS